MIEPQEINHDYQFLEEAKKVLEFCCHKFAPMIKNGSMGIEDLRQVGAISILENIIRYNPAVAKFTTFIKPWIMRDIRNFLYCNNEMMIFSLRTVQDIMILQSSRRKFRKTSGRWPTDQELVDSLKWGEERLEGVKEAIEVIKSVSTSLDDPLDEQIHVYDGSYRPWNRKFSEQISQEDMAVGAVGNENGEEKSIEQQLLNSSLAHQLKLALAELSPAKESCLIESEVLGKNLPEVAKLIGLTKERSRQLIKQAIFEVRNSPHLARLAEFNGRSDCLGILLNFQGEQNLSQAAREQIRMILLDCGGWQDLYGYEKDRNKLYCLEMYFGLADKFYSLKEVGKKLLPQPDKNKTLQLLQDALEKLPAQLRKQIVAAIKNGKK